MYLLFICLSVFTPILVVVDCCCCSVVVIAVAVVIDVVEAYLCSFVIGLNVSVLVTMKHSLYHDIWH